MKLREEYLVALPVDDEFLKTFDLDSLKNKVDIFEFRVDQFKNKDISYIIELMKNVRSKGFYIILTIRSEEEGGTFIPDEKRLEMFNRLVDFADIVDIELSSRIKEQVISLTKEKGKLSLISYHDFEKTPSGEEIQKIIDEGKAAGGDIIKYAFKTNSHEDVSRILCITDKNREKNLVAIGMGELGKITRVAGFIFGSLITYTFVGKSFAPGQIELEKLLEELKFYGLRS